MNTLDLGLWGVINAPDLRQHRTIWQEHSAKDFASYESYKRAGILYVFPPFITARMGQKIGRRPQTQLCGDALYLDGRGQLVVDIVAAILDGNHAAALEVGYHGHRLSHIATQRKKESIQLLIVRIDLLDDIFLPVQSIQQCHIHHLFSVDSITCSQPG